MLERQGLALTQRHDHEGLILLDTEGYVVQTSLKGQEYLALLAGVGVGESLTYLGERSLQELTALPSTPKMEICHEVVLAGQPCQAFTVVIQPVLTEAQFKGWTLVIREVNQEQLEQALLESQERPALIVHWPPASPLTSNLP
jgi:hypothetical protein